MIVFLLLVLFLLRCINHSPCVVQVVVVVVVVGWLPKIARDLLYSFQKAQQTEKQMFDENLVGCWIRDLYFGGLVVQYTKEGERTKNTV